MMHIRCPWCGPRDESEFVCGGERVAPRPSDPATFDDDAWLDRMMNRDNRRGVHVEMWWHAKGCLTWFAITRDTVTHEIMEPSP
jgi:heterotetrameric sarcosine oxidase delta subunit